MSPSEQARWFDEEVRPYEPALRAYLLKRFPPPNDHDDLVQEAYKRVLHARQSGRLTCVKAFLFTAARNLAIDWLRRRQSAPHEPISELVELPALEAPADLPESLEHRERLELLVEAVSALPQRCRQVMMLRHLDGLRYKEIARRLGISPETVKVHMVKGVRECTAFFRSHGLLDGTGETETTAVAEEIAP